MMSKMELFYVNIEILSDHMTRANAALVPSVPPCIDPLDPRQCRPVAAAFQKGPEMVE